jgi:HD-GYP domain-containing protein (c-di-GMP phosphodiesterase class II)
LRRLPRDDEDRSYRKALSQVAALAKLEANSGTQFDPQVVAALIAAVRG